MTAVWFPWRWRLATVALFLAAQWLGGCLLYGAAQ